VYFWDGGWLGIGTGRGVVAPHSHHAIQVTLGLSDRVRFREPEGEWVECDGAAILPNAPHSFDGSDVLLVMLFMDPECREGRWLRHSMRGPIHTIAAERFEAFRQPLLEFPDRRPAAGETARLLTALAHSLCDGPPPLRRIDERIARVLGWLRGLDASAVSLEQAAREVFLSPSRFAHLFTAEVGLPFRRYLLWRKLNRAIRGFAHGASLTDAAYEAGFSDSAHLTRTFYQMFGIPPTIMMGGGEFYEIPAPFEIELPVPPGSNRAEEQPDSGRW
jgi:AraC family transcriptional regulator